jgi:hypothetical protein
MTHHPRCRYHTVAIPKRFSSSCNAVSYVGKSYLLCKKFAFLRVLCASLVHAFTLRSYSIPCYNERAVIVINKNTKEDFKQWLLQNRRKILR